METIPRMKPRSKTQGGPHGVIGVQGLRWDHQAPSEVRRSLPGLMCRYDGGKAPDFGGVERVNPSALESCANAKCCLLDAQRPEFFAPQK